MQKYYITSKFVVHKIECEILAAGDPSALNMIFATPETIKEKAKIFVSANKENDLHVFCACSE